jgi:hypothetical protein
MPEGPVPGVCEICGERSLFARERRCYRHPLQGKER